MKARQVLTTCLKEYLQSRWLLLNQFSWQWLLIDVGWHSMLPPANSLIWLAADIQLNLNSTEFYKCIKSDTKFTEN